MRTRLPVLGLAALLACGCGSGSSTPAASGPEGIALVAVRPTTTASRRASPVPGCAGCTSAFGAELTIESQHALADVNLWLDGLSGTKRCLYARHDSPGDGFALSAGATMRVGFHQATVECKAPFAVDRIEVRARSGDALVFQGSWPVSLVFQD
jgi:hypothetical protein